MSTTLSDGRRDATAPNAPVAPVSPAAGSAPSQPPAARPGAALTPGALRSGVVAESVPGVPSSGPAAGPEGPAPGPTPTPGPGPGGASGGTGPSPAPSPGAGAGSVASGAGDAFAVSAASTFLDLIRNASSPDALEAQNIILRRIALQGDVVTSRVPPPRNITEIGGYLNLLTTWNELEMRSQVLAGILGVAGPNPPLGWAAPSTALGFRPMVNDRPAGPGQAGLPVTVMVRSDFYDPLQAALNALHDRGCVLPLVSGPLALPPAGGTGTLLLDPLDYLGRVLRIAAGQALADPATDRLALVRPAGGAAPFALAARSDGGGSVAVANADYDALVSSGGAIASASLSQAPMVMVGPLLATAGFSLAGAVPQVGGTPSDSWARFTNVGGLVAGTTRLGDELELLHDRAEIAASAFAGMQSWRWTGTAFAP